MWFHFEVFILNFSKLGLHLPHPVDSKNGKAQWDGGRFLLTVSLSMTREYDFMNFWYQNYFHRYTLQTWLIPSNRIIQSVFIFITFSLIENISWRILNILENIKYYFHKYTLQTWLIPSNRIIQSVFIFITFSFIVT